MRVERISVDEARPWILGKHYAKRMPPITHAFGLMDGCMPVGVVAYGMPACQANASMGEHPMIELVRLVVDSAERNASSFLVANSLKLLPAPMAVVSYADISMGHIGFVYQATNWIYTGISRGDVEYVIDGKHVHRKHAHNLYGTGSKKLLEGMGMQVESIRQGDKHRYYYFLGSKTERREMANSLKHPILPYPKGETKRYDASTKIERQVALF